MVKWIEQKNGRKDENVLVLFLTYVSLVANQACYPLHHQDLLCWQHSKLIRCI